MFKQWIRSFLKTMGYEIRRFPPPFDPAMEEEFKTTVKKLEGYHAQTRERLYALFKALKYIVAHDIPGDIVECGVYKGASPMVAGYVLRALKSLQKNIYLYDTFEGMSEGTDHDIEILSGKSAGELLEERGLKGWQDWSKVSLEEVLKNVRQTGYPNEKFIFVKGKVEETIPANCPEKISLLRLDTDWYESTYHELVHLYPKLSPYGVLIVDDYGHWKGAKEAVDRYFSETKSRIFLQRIDYTGYIGIKT